MHKDTSFQAALVLWNSCSGAFIDFSYVIWEFVMFHCLHAWFYLQNLLKYAENVQFLEQSVHIWI